MVFDMKNGALPNLVIFGAMKCGTSSLHEYLAVHPDVHMSTPKELDFFLDRNWHRGLDWYRSKFSAESIVRGESSPNYSKYPYLPGAPERMGEVIPKAKLIYMVREPIKRIASHYIHNICHGREYRPIEQVLADDGSDIYFTTSRYRYQIDRFLKFFPEEQLLVLSLEDLSKNPVQTVGRALSFLDLEPHVDESVFNRVFNASSVKKRPIPAARWLSRYGKLGTTIRSLFSGIIERPVEKPLIEGSLLSQLKERLYPEVEGLRSLTGEDFPYWSI
jgi:hypothetical protein